MPIHDFYFQFRERLELKEDFVSALYECCPDCTVSTRNCLIKIAFAREAPTYKEASESAIADVRRAISMVALEPIPK
jgi:hypothetical protein